MAQPFSATFSGLAKGEYRVDAYIVNSVIKILSRAQLNHDYATQIGVGDIYVAIGDSITEGYDGVAYNVPPYTSWLQAPIASTDYRNYPQCGISSGAYQDHWQEASHHITLNDELAAFLGYPVFILNEGFAGITTSGYVSRMGLTQMAKPNRSAWCQQMAGPFRHERSGRVVRRSRAACKTIVNIAEGHLWRIRHRHCSCGSAKTARAGNPISII